MADTSGVLARLQASLAVYDPTWDVGVGTATYKILEAVAQEIALANNNSTLQTYSYDISTKFGAELDSFCNLFGVYRQLGKRASGVVTFSINAPATNIIDIPVGTQVAVPIGGNYTSAVYFATTAPAIIGINSSSVDVPVVAVLPGAGGNVPAGTIVTKVNSLVSVTSVNNNSAITGGLDPESDTALRYRWQSTAFNNTTGTPGKYYMTAMQDPNVNTVNTVDQQTFYNEQLQINTFVNGTGSGVTFLLVAYGGMTSVVSGTTFSGTTIVASSGFTTATSGFTLASGLTTLISGVAPNSGIIVSANANTLISGTTGITLSYNLPNPYRLIIGSGAVYPGSSVTTSGVTTISGVNFYNFVQSNNPDVGLSGTLSYNGTYSGYVYPQGNELLGSGINTANQLVYANLTDYYYPVPAYAPLTINIANSANRVALFQGNTIQVTSEYNPACNRSLTLTSGNYVDIIIDGTSASTATEQVTFNPNLVLTNGNAVSYLNTTNYTLASGAVASTNARVANNIYVPLDQQPTINFPSQLATSSLGVADTIYLYNVGTSSGTAYPIALNPYPYITFTGTVTSGAGSNQFIQVSNANQFLYPGLALASGTVTSGTTFISSVVTSGITINQPIVATGTNVVMSGKAIAYPIYDTTNNQNSVIQSTGLAFDVVAAPAGWPTLPGVLSWATYTHGYNADVVTVEALVQQSRPTGTNTLTHQANFIQMIVNVRIALANGYNITTVQSSIFNQLSTYLNGFSYLAPISFSALAAQILLVSGVANAKVTSVNIVALDGTITSTQNSDFNLASNQLPALYSIAYTVKGNNNF